ETCWFLLKELYKKDLLYIRFDEKNQQIINKRVTEDIVLDIGEEDKIVGMEILGASKLLNLRELLPVSYELETHS
ncbi:MAG TPA: DUF2283 domain-containing protein, partial [bacterium]|nr:DUF2283 domain-containing protein [bacterium]